MVGSPSVADVDDGKRRDVAGARGAGPSQQGAGVDESVLADLRAGLAPHRLAAVQCNIMYP